MESDQNNNAVHRRRHRKHSPRRLRLLLLCFGVGGLVIGVGLALGGYFMANSTRLLAIGIGYILASAALLAIRGAMIVIRQIRDQEYEGE